MSSIPEELYHEILLRLPVKSLLVCKSVCKTWYELIISPDFVKSHLNLSKTKPILMIQGVVHTTMTSDSSLVYSIDYDSLEPSSCPRIEDDDVIINLEDDDVIINAIEIDYPFKHSGYSIVHLLGSVNGLFCIKLYDSNADDGRILLCLWNPATREYKEIPESPIDLNDNCVGFDAFCYDDKNDDFKLVIGVEVDDENKNTTRILVDTLASNSWKTGKIAPYPFSYEQGGVLFNGDLHWLTPAQNLLLSMDINDESFKEMQLPKELIMDKRLYKYMLLGVLEGCLCLLVSWDTHGPFEVWEMLDYGVQDSWVKRHVIAHHSIINRRFCFRLVWSFKNWVVLFSNGRGLVLYDLKDGNYEQLKINFNPFLEHLNTQNYFESLVSLNSGTYVGGRTQPKNESIPEEGVLGENHR